MREDPLAGLPDSVEIVEVGPRDGLQNERASLPVEARVELVRRLAAAGLRRIEAGAFVSPKWVPQMAASDELFRRLAGLPELAGVRLSALVPNARGLARAREAGVTEIAVFGAASETFSRRNLNASIAESLARFRELVAAARDLGLRVRGYVSCIAGCPYEGDVPTARVVEVAGALYDMGCAEIALGDTIGTGTPRHIARVVRACAGRVPVARLALHLHDTYGQALANALAGLECGVRVLDAAVGGLGGCPYAPGASGNLATEDLVYMLEGSGVRTGVDLDALVETARWICGRVGRTPTARVTLARTAACAR